MALNQFIPQVWAGRIQLGLEKKLVFGQPGVVNTDYQGDISAYGDTVHVHSFGDLSIGNYEKNSTTINYELLDDARVSLVIDQSKYFAFKVDDVDIAQQYPKVIDAASDRASYQLAELADRHLASHVADAEPANVIAASQFTASNVYKKFVDLAVEMDIGLVPDTGRFAVVPPWVAGLLAQNGEFLSAKPDVVLNGMVGQVSGINILKSVNVPVTSGTPDVHNIMAGVSEAISFAQQISSVEGIRLEGSFSDGVRGLHLYGAKTLRPELLFNLKANQ